MYCSKDLLIGLVDWRWTYKSRTFAARTISKAKSSHCNYINYLFYMQVQCLITTQIFSTIEAYVCRECISILLLEIVKIDSCNEYLIILFDNRLSYNVNLISFK